VSELLGNDARKREIVESEYPHAEPTRAIYFGVFFRDLDSRLRVATDNFYAQRKLAELFIELRKPEDIDYFIVALSVPVSAEETGMLGQDLSAAFTKVYVDAQGKCHR
jgi:hypothetical protein